jgi:hypothetical protein
MDFESDEISRRDLLKIGGLTATGIAAAGVLAACAPSSTGGDAAEGGAETQNGGATGEVASWRNPPAEIAEFVKELDFDVVCVGHGYAGVASCRELSENGVKVALIEKQPEDAYIAVGNESASFNSKLLMDRGLPPVDPIEFYQNWQAATQNYTNADLVMKFAQNCGANSDWYYSVLSDEEVASMETTSWVPGAQHRLDQVGPFKFYPDCAKFNNDVVNQTQIQVKNREAARAAGAEFFFETSGEYVIMDGGKVAGVAAAGPDGAYKFNCKAVIIATGGFSNNNDMIKDLMSDLWNDTVEGESFNSGEGGGMGNANAFGRGIQMAYWAGAHLENIPVPGMNSRMLMPPMLTILPQAVWLNTKGQRFCDEYYPFVEHRGTPAIFFPRQPVTQVMDSDILTYRQYYAPSHGVWEPTEGELASFSADLDKAKAKFDGTWVEPEPSEEEGDAIAMMMMATEYVCDDTLEGLAAQLGYTGDAAKNFVESINNYNTYCDNGADAQYGRYKEVLFPVKKAPFFATVVSGLHMGDIMCTVGGILTDGEQNALDKGYEPIPGLYVSGNDCGRRFGYEYFTPAPGVSLAMAQTLGRECGRSVKKYLQG